MADWDQGNQRGLLLPMTNYQNYGVHDPEEIKGPVLATDQLADALSQLHYQANTEIDYRAESVRKMYTSTMVQEQRRQSTSCRRTPPRQRRLA